MSNFSLEIESPKLQSTPLESFGVRSLYSNSSATLQIDNLHNFRYRIERELKQDKTVSKRILEEIETLLGKGKSTLKRLLMPVETIHSRKTRKDSILSITLNESLIKILLQIMPLQTKIMELLLEMLPIIKFGHGEEDDNEVDTTKTVNQEENIARLIISQFKWLEEIENSRGFTERLLVTLSNCPVSVKLELIIAIPDIVKQKDHALVVEQFHEEMQSNEELISPSLDSLGRLNLNGKLMERTIRKIVEQLSCVDLYHLAVLVRFLLIVIKPETADLVVYHLFEKLDISSITMLHQSQFSIKSRSNLQKYEEQQNSEALIFGVLKKGIKFNKLTSGTCYKYLDKINSQDQFQIIHFWVTIILLEIVSFRKKTILMAKKKIKLGIINQYILTESVTKHERTLKASFETLMVLASTLVQDKDSRIQRAGIILYIVCFQSFNNPFSRQEIIGTIATHIGSGIPSEIDASLDTLRVLSQRSPDNLKRFSILIVGVLEYLESFQPKQIRVLFQIFGSLTSSTIINQTNSFTEIVNTDGSIETEIQIVIRKQINNLHNNYKKIGILAGISYVQQLLADVKHSRQLQRRSNNNNNNNNTDQQRGKERERELEKLRILQKELINNQILSILKTLLSVIKMSKFAANFLYDELAILIFNNREIFPKSILNYIFELVTQIFENKFLKKKRELNLIYQNSGSNNTNSLPFQIGFWYKLENPSLFEKQINTSDKNYGLFLSDKFLYDPREQENLFSLCSSFRLFQTINFIQKKGQSFDGVLSSLLDDPILLFDKDYLKNFNNLSSSLKDIICLSLFHTSNWFRELLNTFSIYKDTIIHQKILLRLINIIEIENFLKQLLLLNSQFQIRIIPQFMNTQKNDEKSDDEEEEKGNEEKDDNETKIKKDDDEKKNKKKIEEEIDSDIDDEDDDDEDDDDDDDDDNDDDDDDERKKRKKKKRKKRKKEKRRKRKKERKKRKKEKKKKSKEKKKKKEKEKRKKEKNEKKERKKKKEKIKVKEKKIPKNKQITITTISPLFRKLLFKTFDLLTYFELFNYNTEIDNIMKYDCESNFIQMNENKINNQNNSGNSKYQFKLSIKILEFLLRNLREKIDFLKWHKKGFYYQIQMRRKTRSLREQNSLYQTLESQIKLFTSDQEYSALQVIHSIKPLLSSLNRHLIKLFEESYRLVNEPKNDQLVSSPISEDKTGISLDNMNTLSSIGQMDQEKRQQLYLLYQNNIILIFQIFKLVFSSTPFQTNQNDKLFRECLFEISNMLNENSKQDKFALEEIMKEINEKNSIDKLIDCVFKNLERLCDKCTSLWVASDLCQFMAVIIANSQNSHKFYRSLANISMKFLLFDWGLKDKPFQTNSVTKIEYLKQIINLIFIKIKNLKIINYFLKILKEFDLSKSTHHHKLKTLSKGTFHVFYGTLLSITNELFDSTVRQKISSSSKSSSTITNQNPNSSNNNASSTSLIEKVFTILHYFRELALLTRNWKSPIILSLLLKEAKRFLDKFLKFTPFLQKNFTENVELINKLFRPLQKFTRQLQSICSDMKIAGNFKLIKLVPQLRKLMEKVIYEVKLLFEKVQSNGITIEKLRNKNISGDLVASQLPVIHNNNNSSSDEEGEEDEEDEEDEDED
ncbi:fanconi anemia group d2 protein [Anaeramoeba flamelloides]|uniref:Fanconi anemia group d2 protein n=1 Tax=Anaeramoeba flamelloides TaxID=1746091 RepID=A0ABQ8Y5G1_9EUKA|nr:fanconi anemia group d2 protein [Anaeramoeba flamelloides]